MAEQYFRAKAYRRVSKTTPQPDAEAGPYTEPADAADWAEEWLMSNGTPDESFVDLYFNGEGNIHTSIYLLMHDGEKTFGVLNSKHCRWPFYYMEGQGETFAPGMEPFGRDTDEWMPGDSDEDETSDDADSTDIEDFMEGNEKPSDKGGEDSEEMPEDDEDEDEGEIPDETGDDEDDDDEEVPRMTIFGKFRGPKGWRKRAETDPERDMNVFSVKFGVLDPDRRTSAQQERNSRVEVRFIERNSRRDAGELRIRIPSGVQIKDDGKWLVAEIPYTDQED
jgi:AAA ATPase containing von Willebrand factor type A (vWA) domain